MIIDFLFLSIALIPCILNLVIFEKALGKIHDFLMYKILLLITWSGCEIILLIRFFDDIDTLNPSTFSDVIIIPFLLLYTWIYYSEIHDFVMSNKSIKRNVIESIILLVILTFISTIYGGWEFCGCIEIILISNLLIIKKMDIEPKVKLTKYLSIIGGIVFIISLVLLLFSGDRDYSVSFDSSVSQNANDIYKVYKHNRDENMDILEDISGICMLASGIIAVNSMVLFIVYNGKKKNMMAKRNVENNNTTSNMNYFNRTNSGFTVAVNNIEENNEFIEEMAKLAGCKKLNMYSDDVYQAKKDELIKGLTKVVILENKETFMVPLLPLFEEKLLTQGDIDNISEIFDKKDTLRKLNNDELIELFVNNEDLKEYIITEAGKRGVTAEYLEKYKELNLLEDDSLLTVYCMPLKITNLKNDYSKIIAKEIFFKRGIDVDELFNYKKKLPELSDYKIIEIYKEDKSKLIDIIDENNRVKAEEKKNLKEAQQKIRQEKIEKINNNLNQNINDAKENIKIQFQKIFKKLKEVIKNPKVINATLIVATVVMMLSSVNIIYKRVIKKNIITNEIVNESMSNEKIDDKFTIDSDIKILNQYYNGNTGIAEVNATADVTDGSSINKELKITLWYKKENGKWVEEDRNYAIK